MSSNLQELSPVFVVGPQRTGTTLLGRILADHEQSSFTVNCKLLYYLKVWLEASSEKESYWHFRADEIVHSLKRKPIIGVGDNFIDDVLAPVLFEVAREGADSTGNNWDESAGLSGLVRKIMNSVHSELNPSAKFWGDKYNEYLLMLDWLRGIYPDARFVMTYRDGEAVGRSMAQRFQDRPWCPTNEEACCDKYLHWKKIWESKALNIRPNNKLTIIYEELVDDIMTQLRRLADFVGLDQNDLYKYSDWIIKS